MMNENKILSKADFSQGMKYLSEIYSPDLKKAALMYDLDLVPCNPADPAPAKEKKDNKMSHYNEAVASTTVVTVQKSDAALQREYLLEELKNMTPRWYSSPTWVRDDLAEMFHVNKPGHPTDPRELVRLIKEGKYKLNEKKLENADKQLELDHEEFDEEEKSHIPEFYGPIWNFITFEGYPKPDHDGFEKGLKAWEEALEKTRRTIMVFPPEEGLKALEALKVWKYKPKS